MLYQMGVALKRYYEGFKEGLSLFSISAVKKWITIVIATCAFLVWGIGSGSGPMENLFSVARYIGYMFATGIPFVVGASLLFSSSETQNNIADSIRKGTNVRFRSLFIPYVIMTLVVMTFIVAIGFVFVLPSLPLIWAPWFFSSLLVSTLAISLLVCPIVAFLALTVDDWKISTFLGILLFFAFSLATGTPGFPVNFPELAFLGPAHIVAALLFIMIGGFTEYIYVVDYYVGVDFLPGQLVVPILILVSIGVVTQVLAERVFNSNLPRWASERDLWLSPKGDDTRWLESEEKTSEDLQGQLRIKLAASQNALKQRRRMAASILVIAIILIPVGGMGYVSMQQGEWTTVVYQTSGMTVEIGEWLYGEFTGLDAPDNIFLRVGCEGMIIGGGSGSVKFNFDHRGMTLTDFLQLNDTELEDTFGKSWSENFGETGEFHSGWGGPINNQQYVWVLRFFEVYGITEGSIEISFQVIIRAL